MVNNTKWSVCSDVDYSDMNTDMESAASRGMPLCGIVWEGVPTALHPPKMFRLPIWTQTETFLHPTQMLPVLMLRSITDL